MLMFPKEPAWHLMSWLQQDKHRIKISSVEFIKIPSAAKKLQLFTMEWDSSPENCKTTKKKEKDSVIWQQQY